MDRSQLQKATGRRGRSRRAGGQFARAARFGGVVGAGLGGFDFLDDVGCRGCGFGGLEGEEAEEGEFGVGGCGGHVCDGRWCWVLWLIEGVVIGELELKHVVCKSWDSILVALVEHRCGEKTRTRPEVYIPQTLVTKIPDLAETNGRSDLVIASPVITWEIKVGQ